MPDTGKSSDVVKAIPEAAVDPTVTKVYGNGFAIGMSNADVQILLKLNGQSVALVNLSYTLAKTLSVRLGGLIADWESKTGHQLVMTDSVDDAFNTPKVEPE